MSHFDECNIKAWEGTDNPPPWCNCQTIAEVEISGREQAIRDCIAAVEALPWSTQTWQAHDERASVIAVLRALLEKP